MEETFTDLIGSKAHWFFEIFSSFVQYVIAYPFIRFAVRVHDKRRHHKKECEHE